SRLGRLQCRAARFERLAQRPDARDLAEHAEIGVACRAFGLARGALQTLARGTVQVNLLAHAGRSGATRIDRDRDLYADRVGHLRRVGGAARHVSGDIAPDLVAGELLVAAAGNEVDRGQMTRAS